MTRRVARMATLGPFYGASLSAFLTARLARSRMAYALTGVHSTRQGLTTGLTAQHFFQMTGNLQRRMGEESLRKADEFTYVVAHRVFADTHFRDEKCTRRAFSIIVTTMIDGMIAVVVSIASVIAQGWFGAAFDRRLQNRLTAVAGQLIVTNERAFTASVLVAQIFTMARKMVSSSSVRALQESAYCKPQLSILLQTNSHTCTSRWQQTSVQLKTSVPVAQCSKREWERQETYRCLAHSFFLLHRRSHRKGFLNESY